MIGEIVNKADVFFDSAHAVANGNGADANVFKGDSSDEGENDG
jgi:hypothetical protein